MGNKKNVYHLGFVSLFTDISSELLFPILPFFILYNGGTMIHIGLLESLASIGLCLTYIFSGYIADIIHKNKILTIMGYSISTISKSFLLLPFNIINIYIFRFLDRIGKGIRTAPRDSIISLSTSLKERGKYFGIHRTMDTIGAIIGILLIFIILYTLGENQSTYKLAFIIALIASIIGTILLFKVSDKNTNYTQKSADLFSLFRDKDLKKIATFIFIFNLSQISTIFFLIYSQQIGITLLLIPAIYLLLNFFYAISAIPFGIFCDVKSPLQPLRISVSLFLVFILSLILLPPVPYLIPLQFIIYGLYLGAYDVSIRTLITSYSKKNNLSTNIGSAKFIESISVIIANIFAGFIWNYYGAAPVFTISSIFSIIGLAILYLVKIRNKSINYKLKPQYFRFYR